MFLNIGNATDNPYKIRLLNGASESQGLVDIGFRNAWGSVADNYWDRPDGEVVCRELGFEGILATTYSGAFGSVYRRRWLQNAHCSGQEQSFLSCVSGGWGLSDSSWSGYAGVICIGM